jgi:hypothetical protein
LFQRNAANESRHDELAKGVTGKRLTYLVVKTFRFKAERFLRWERKQPKP